VVACVRFARDSRHERGRRVWLLYTRQDAVVVRDHGRGSCFRSGFAFAVGVRVRGRGSSWWCLVDAVGSDGRSVTFDHLGMVVEQTIVALVHRIEALGYQYRQSEPPRGRPPRHSACSAC